jgi:hypothetical protein
MAQIPKPQPAQSAKADWSREFKELGTDAVRSALISGKWDREKKAAARVWIETADARRWQEKRGDGPGKQRLIRRLQKSPMWKYVMPAIGALMGIGLILRRMHM